MQRQRGGRCLGKTDVGMSVGNDSRLLVSAAYGLRTGNAWQGRPQTRTAIRRLAIASHETQAEGREDRHIGRLNAAAATSIAAGLAPLAVPQTRVPLT